MSENVNSTGTAKSNYEGSQEQLIDHANAIKKQALADLVTSDKKGFDGTAGQRMAAAILYQYEAFKMGSPVPRNLADYMGKIETKARTDLLKLYTNHLLGAMPANPRGESAKLPGAKIFANDVMHNMQTEWKRQRALVARGLELASVLVKGNIPMQSFDEKAGIWTVTRALFCKDGFKVMGDETLTQLNGKSFFAGKSVAGKNVQLDKINASVTRLLQAHRVTAPRATGSQAGNAAAATTGNTAKSAFDKAGLDDKVKSLRADLIQRNGDKTWVPNINDFGKATWNSLMDIARVVNEWNSIETFYVKPTAKRDGKTIEGTAVEVKAA